MLGWQGVCRFTTEHKSLCHREQSGYAEVCPMVPEGSAHGELRPACQPGGLPPPAPLATHWWQVHPTSKALTLKGSDGPFAWGGGRGAVGTGASVPHVFQLSALFLFYAAFPWSSESGEAGCDGEESGERAEEKGNRVENAKM